MKKLLLATSNPHKVKEMKYILRHLPYDVVTLNDLGLDVVMPEETGSTFRENAYIKARHVYDYVNNYYPDTWVLADDSGLSVKALGGAPGIHSARYKGLSSPEARLKAVLFELKDVPWEKRVATFITVMCLITDFAEVFTQGIVEGYITYEPMGTSGFGYDPIFYYPPMNKTYAEMAPEEKNSISHRARATSNMIIVLQKFA